MLKSQSPKIDLSGASFAKVSQVPLASGSRPPWSQNMGKQITRIKQEITT